MSINRNCLRTMVVFCACVGLLASAAAPATAKVQHKYLFQITEVAPGPNVEKPGLLSGVNAMTVNDGHLWVDEHAQKGCATESACSVSIDEFNDETGAFEWQLPLAQATPSSIYTLDEGIAIGQINGAEHAYVGSDYEPPTGKRFGAVSIFDIASGGFLEDWSGAGTPAGTFGVRGVKDVAVDESSDGADWAAGDVYVADDGQPTSEAERETPEDQRVVDVFRPQAAGGEHYLTQLTGPSPVEHFRHPLAVAVSPVNGEVAVVDEAPKVAGEEEAAVIDLFRPAGLGEYEFVGRLTSPNGGDRFHGVTTVAIDDSGELYLAGIDSPDVYQYDAELHLVDALSGAETPQGSFRARSIAVDPSSQHVFVGDYSFSAAEPSVVDAFSADLVVPDVGDEAPSNVKAEYSETAGHTWNVRINGTVNPDGVGVASCWFLWGTTKALGQRAECSASVANSSEPLRVHASLTGLPPDTTYYYRLQASNTNGTDFGEESQDLSFTTPGPGLGGEWVSEVDSSHATLDAAIAPHDAPVGEGDLQTRTNGPTVYYFQYSRESTVVCDATPAGCTSVPLAPEATGVAGGVAHVSQQLEGLEPNTIYHYRVIAESEAQPEADPGARVAFYGADQTFTTQRVATPLTLPDDRQWELVTPADTHGALPYPLSELGLTQAAASGQAFTYLDDVPDESYPQGFDEEAQVLARRGTGGGWSSEDIEQAYSQPTGVTLGYGQASRFFSEELDSTIVEPASAFSQPEVEGVSLATPRATEQTPLLRHNDTCATEPSSCFEPLVTGADGEADVPSGTVFGPGGKVFGESNADYQVVRFVDSTPDTSHVIVSSEISLSDTPPVYKPVASGDALYEWSGGSPATQRLQLVSILPAGEGAEAVPAQIGGEPLNVGEGYDMRHAISTDGSRVFFTSDADGQSKGHIYMRDMPGGETIRLDVPEAGVSGEQQSASFQGANADGSRVFFTTFAHLVKDAGSSGADLYECRIVQSETAGASHLGCELRDLTPVPAAGQSGAGEAAQVQGNVLGVSEDGSYVYFVARGVQAQGAAAGQDNLYVSHEGAISLIATLSSDDAPDWESGTQMTARVSPNGAWLAFMSDRSLTGYDNLDASSGLPDEEVYLYDAPAHRLVCASCNPSGARPHGIEAGTLESSGDKLVLNSEGGSFWTPESQWIAASVPGMTPYSLREAIYQSRYLSNEGRLFFDSSDALVPQDANGNEDVYEYEPVAVGPAGAQCGEGSSTFSPSAYGCIGLISSGVADGESAFMDAGEGGGDVFFITQENLAPGASGTGLKIYDAHECTSASPCPPAPPVQPQPCTDAESCRAAPTPQPAVFGAPASATFNGAGNVMPSSASTGTVGGSSANHKTTRHKKARKAKRRTAGRRHGKRVARGGGRKRHAQRVARRARRGGIGRSYRREVAQ